MISLRVMRYVNDSGWHYRNRVYWPAHIEALRRPGNVSVVALCDSSLGEGAGESPGVKRSARLRQAWRHYWRIRDCRVVHNCTPNHLHADINRQVLRAGVVWLFSEKPLCMTPDEARELAALAEQAGVVHGVSFVYRQFAMVQQAASMVRAGSVGRQFSVQGSYLQDWMLLETDYNWRVDPALGGSSRAVADIGSHWGATRCSLLLESGLWR
ncbi:oxidoreductase [Citrobacter koseri]|uniref:Oxidoreductase n=1 Tax=Citrobacter koseri TaxID=545 RepID=A0A2X2V6X7_CITKO|nr:oxidoreductase [Citrobacter koseri]